VKVPANARATSLAWGVLDLVIGGAGCLDNTRRSGDEKPDGEELNHERPIKGLPVNSIGDAAEPRKLLAYG
jgi:hypothetical protein